MYLGIDIGGTKTLIGLFTNKGELKDKFRFETPKTYESFLATLRRHLEPFTNEDVQAVGIGAPGVINRKHGVGKDFGNLSWKNVPIRKDIELITGIRAVVDNDANLAGLSEARNINDDLKKVLFLTISTGIGGGIITNGIIDPNFADSEPGWMLLDYQGKPAEWESFASGHAIKERFGKIAAEIKDQKTWKVIVHDWASGFISLIALIQPDIIIVGGGVGAHFDRYGDLLKKELKKYETPLTPIPPIKQAARPEDAVLYGCYELAKDSYEKST